jgi:hypothetical protein
MRQLFYTNYQSGSSGLSNGIMSIECAVVMAFLTKRFLLIDGNQSPPANIVNYDGRVDNTRPSRVTDLIDIPIPWSEPDEAALAGLASEELTPYSLMDSVFYMPGGVDIQSADAIDFARGRDNWICESPDLAQVPVLRVSEQPLVPGTDTARHNLSFYSYLFYLDDENRKAVYDLLSRTQAQQPYADLARRVAADLGDFNAVHMRRGDFKVTYGVTVLDRQPWEAVEALEAHFKREDRLLICTDERSDPFFNDIKIAWPDHIFIDHHILDNYASEFAALPHRDSLALAYLSQLVAAASMDFVGSMTSTFTAMIQRMRGNRGKNELFKFLWNELPDPGERLERGSHAISECVPLEQGIMVSEFEGTYSWNHYTDRLNPAWMREWPESFLTPQVLATGRLNVSSAASYSRKQTPGKTEEAIAYFDGLRIRIKSATPGLASTLGKMLYDSEGETGGSVIAEFGVQKRGIQYLLTSQSETVAEVRDLSEVPAAILNQVVPLLSQARKRYSWFNGMVLARGDQTILIVGDWAHEAAGVSIAGAMCRDGWDLLGDQAVPVRIDPPEVVPFVRCASIAMQPGRHIIDTHRLDAVVYASLQLHNRDTLFALSPSAAVAEMTRACRDFPLNRTEAVKRLCTLAERVPVYQLCYSQPENASRALAELPLRGEYIIANSTHG